MAENNRCKFSSYNIDALPALKFTSIHAIHDKFAPTKDYMFVAVYSDPSQFIDTYQSHLQDNTWVPFLKRLHPQCNKSKKDASFMFMEQSGCVFVSSPTGPTNRDFDDVRTYKEAVASGVKMALKHSGGAINLVILLQKSKNLKIDDPFSQYRSVSALSALAELHVLPEIIEGVVNFGDSDHLLDKIKIQKIELYHNDDIESGSQGNEEAFVLAMERGRRLARDIGGSDPERITPLKASERIVSYFNQNFNDLVGVNVVSNFETISRDYPLLAAVARASLNTPRHSPCVVHLDYKSDNPQAVTKNIYMVGKGITYDTGGADLKVGGHMVGMSRDKAGAAALAGFCATVASLRPRNINLHISLAFVRNSIGSNSYVSDEIIRSRAGVRVRVGNTDAEGRMVMADLLGQMAEKASHDKINYLSEVSKNCNDPSTSESDPYMSMPRYMLFTCATLTGHVIRAYGPYAAALENRIARCQQIGFNLKTAGDKIGDPLEISSVRRDDYEFVQATSDREDLVQANSLPSTLTNRGHQYPFAFLDIASGLYKMNYEDQCQLAYIHLDIAGSAEEGPGPLGRLTGSPIPALTCALLRDFPN